MSRRGFTLVELLVSAGLVVLMLLMFATIFQIATSSMGIQKGIAENDQRARTLTTTMRSDILHRTFKSVVPFDAGELAPVSGDTDFSFRDFGRRRGYFYISENDLNDDRDDVLAFTVEYDGEDPLFGRAGHFFYEDLDNNGQFDDGIDRIYQNQPELDGDGDYQNRMARVVGAEVCYFVRGGNLHRRVMLIRSGRGGAEQPQTDDGTDLFDPDAPSGGGTPYDGVFYRDFDNAVYAIDSTDAAGSPNIRVKFHGDDSLENAATSSSFFPLGNPQYRFGHHYQSGQPREFILDANGQPTVFIGRFIHEETSSNSFVYPFSLAQGNPYSQNLVDQDGDAITDAFANGRRRGEDILMTDVHGFDVKVWDDLVGEWRDVGWVDAPQAVVGTYSRSENQHLASGLVYGPKQFPAENNVFDTWHPNLDIDKDGTPDPPPFRATRDTIDGNGNPATVPVPLRAMQLTIRYYDRSSDQNRTLTLEFSLLD